jgi:hypothetical protein
VLESRVLRGIFGPRKDDVTEGWRKLHNELLHNLYSSPSIIRMAKLRTKQGETIMHVGFGAERKKGTAKKTEV